MDIEILNQFKLLTNKAILEDNLIFYSIYLLIFERFKNKFVNELKFFLCDFSIKDGKYILKESKEYSVIVNRKYNGKKNIFVSTIEWFKDIGVITKDEFEEFIKIKNDRNAIGHELLELLTCPIIEEKVDNFANLIKIFKKIDKWWINNIEISTSCGDVPGDYNDNDVMSGDWLLCDMVFNTLYGDNSYKKCLDKAIKMMDGD